MGEIIGDIVSTFLQQFMSTVGSLITMVVAVIGYERLIKKDSNNIATTLAILMTKVDSVLQLNDKVQKHEEMLIRHDEEIKNLKDTNRFQKLTEEIIKGGYKND